MNREDAGGKLFCVGHAYLDKSLHDQQDCYCLITEFRHEATSHGEQGAHDGILSRCGYMYPYVQLALFTIQ